MYKCIGGKELCLCGLQYVKLILGPGELELAQLGREHIVNIGTIPDNEISNVHMTERCFDVI